MIFREKKVCRPIILSAAVIFGGSILLWVLCLSSSVEDVPSSALHDLHWRRLRASHFSDPKSVVPRTRVPVASGTDPKSVVPRTRVPVVSGTDPKSVVPRTRVPVASGTDPKSVVPRTRVPVASGTGDGGAGRDAASQEQETITIYLTRGRKTGAPFPKDASIFKTDILHRYGSGVRYILREEAECNKSCKNLELGLGAGGPCLAVARFTPRMYCNIDRLRCNYPTCKTMIAADEFCERMEEDSYDARMYYTADRSGWGYLPLGPRIDSWRSLQNIRQNHQFFVLPASRRKFAFNAIFSQSTNVAREQLAVDIERRGATSKLPIFASMAKEWSQDANDASNEQLDTDTYMEVVLNSIFTLSPAGHSPECFRIYEALEAGSIPVLSREDLHGSKHPLKWKALKGVAHPCKDTLQHWYEAPIVVLDSWKDLYPVIEGLLEEPAALDEMQAQLRMWYDEYMTNVVRKFEDFMLDR